MFDELARKPLIFFVIFPANSIRKPFSQPILTSRHSTRHLCLVRQPMACASISVSRPHWQWTDKAICAHDHARAKKLKPRTAASEVRHDAIAAVCREIRHYQIF
jgi:hypothetical protein